MGNRASQHGHAQPPLQTIRRPGNAAGDLTPRSCGPLKGVLTQIMKSHPHSLTPLVVLSFGVLTLNGLRPSLPRKAR